MGVIAVVVVWLLPLALLVAAAVWAVNLSGSVYAIQRTLERMDARQGASAVAFVPATAPMAPVRPAPPIDVEPFVD
jgi:hypothetical protein